MRTRKWITMALAALVALGLAGFVLTGCGSSSKAPDTTLVAPILSSLSVNTGPPGTEVTLKGQGLGDGADSRVDFAGTAAEVAEWKDTYIVVYVPSTCQSGAVSVNTPGGTSNPLGFTVETGST